MKSLQLVIIFLQCGSLLSGTILLIPSPGLSHVMYFAQVGKPLVARGHDVYALLNENCRTSVERLKQSKIKVISHFHPDGSCFVEEKIPASDMKKMEGIIATFPQALSTVLMLYIASSLHLSEADAMFGDKPMIKTIEDLNIDLVIDGVPLTLHQYILPYKLNLPYISLTTAFHSSWAGIPDLPSITPCMLSDYTNQMTFRERVVNTLLYGVVSLDILPGRRSSLIAKYAPEKNDGMTANLLQGRSKLWLVNTDVILGYPRPLLPHVIPIGRNNIIHFNPSWLVPIL